MKRIVLIILSLLLAAEVGASDGAEQRNENLVRRAEENAIVKKFLVLSGSKLVEVKDVGDLYEIVFEPTNSKEKSIFYLTKSGQYALFGTLINEDGKSVTKERQDELNKVNFASIPLQDAITIKKGDGRKKVVMISDPDCPFCRKAYHWFEGKNNYTLFIFLFPLDMHPHAREKSIEILCSKDKSAALHRAESDKPIGAEKCEDGEKELKRHILISQILGVNGTPFFIFEDGRKDSGFNPGLFERIFTK